MRARGERNIALVGCGYWGKNLARNFAQLGALHTICDANTEVAQQFRARYPKVNSETEYSRVLQDKEIKAVVASTPAALHYKMANVG